MPIVALAALMAALIGWIAAQGPQPVTDSLLEAGWLEPLQTEEVLLVAMDEAEGVEDWAKAVSLARRAGAAEVAAVNPPVAVDAVRLDRGHAADVGLEADWDGVTRRWTMGKAGDPSFPGRLALSRDEVGLGVHIVASEDTPVPTVGLRNLAYLDPAAMKGRTVVLGELTPWAVPLVETASGPRPLAEVLTRTAAGGDLVPVPRLGAALVGAWLGCLGGALLLLTTRRPRWLVLAPAICVVVALPLAIGVLIPLEVPVLALAGGLLAAQCARWVSHTQGFEALVDRAIWQLHVEPHTVDLERDWQDLCTAAIDLRIADRVWAVECVDGGFLTVSGADGTGLIEVGEDVPTPFADPLVIELKSRCGREGVLLIDKRGESPDLRPLYAVAAHQARKKRVRVPELKSIESYIQVGVAIVNAAFDALLSDASRIKATARAGAHARALFDPLGRLVNIDQSLEETLFPEGRPARPQLSRIWQGAGGTRGEVLGVMNGEGTLRLPHANGGLLLLTASHDRGRLAGFVVELVEAPGAGKRAGMLGPQLVRDGGRGVDRSA
ncbi:MAG TPA: hypothetical protein QGF58_12600 [Myxococcota bacterium]|nr:hypothetical protein [Myxococcota bacterium]